MSLNTTPRTWVVSEVVTAANMNTEIRDALTGIQAAWTSYTPALTAATTNPTLGTGNSTTGAYSRFGKTVTGNADITFGTPGFVAGSGIYEVSLPVAAVAGASTTGQVAGSCIFFDSSATNLITGVLRFQSSTTVRCIIVGTTTGLSAVSPVVPANSDRIHIQFTYQAA